MKRGLHIPVATLILILSPMMVTACPACYGAKDSPMTAGMNVAILVMLGITGAVLTSIVSIFYILWKRNKRRMDNLSQDIFVSEVGELRTTQQQGVVEWNNF